MCELMAMSFDAQASPGFLLREFAARGELNADGWGLGWYPDRSVALIKEPVKWGSSPLARFLETDPSLTGGIFLAHVRDKTVGDAPNHADTHPFAREHDGRDYCFAHNGTLDDRVRGLPLGSHGPIGDTDSEQFFCHLLGQIAARKSHLDEQADWAWLHATLASANRLGKLNCLLSDGRRLFVYRDVNGWKGLHVAQVGPGLAISTYPLGRATWRPISLGELVVFDHGRIVFASHQDDGSMIPPSTAGKTDHARG